jgi:hypothetical protein
MFLALNFLAQDQPILNSLPGKQGQLHTTDKYAFSFLCFQGGEQLFLYVTVYDGKLTSKTEVWARIFNSSAATNSTELTHQRPQPGATAFLPNFRHSFPKGDSSVGGNIPPSFIQPPSPLPEISPKPRPPLPPPPPPLSLEQTTLRIPYTSTTQKPTRGSYRLPSLNVTIIMV